MSAKVLLFAALVFAVTHTGTPLKCYSCVGSKGSDCYGKDKSVFAIDTCSRNNLINKELGLTSVSSNSSDALKIQCVKVTILPSQGFEEPYFLRGCGETYENTNVCELIQQVVPIENCEWCDDKNLCNDY